MSMLTTTEAAALLGIKSAMARRYCEEGRLAATLVGGRWITTAEAVEVFRTTMKKAGRPQKGTSMNTRELAQQARQMVADGEARTIDEAITVVVRQALDRIAGTYTSQAERNWINDVTRVERATR